MPYPSKKHAIDSEGAHSLKSPPSGRSAGRFACGERAVSAPFPQTTHQRGASDQAVSATCSATCLT